MEQRLTRVEEACTFIQHDLGELDEVVRSHADAIDSLRREIDRLRGVIHDLRNPPEVADEDETDPDDGS